MKSEIFSREMREIWEEFGDVGNEILDVANEVERNGEIDDKSLKAAQALSDKLWIACQKVAEILLKNLKGGEESV